MLLFIKAQILTYYFLSNNALARATKLYRNTNLHSASNGEQAFSVPSNLMLSSGVGDCV